jgi:hypothetical protein
MTLLAEPGAKTFRDTFGADNTEIDTMRYLASAFGPTIQAGELRHDRTTFLIAQIGGSAAGYARLRLRHRPPEPSDPFDRIEK